MSDSKWVKLEDLRQPGMRRVLDAQRQVAAETPERDGTSPEPSSLVEEASLAADQIAERLDGRGRRT
jgi:hypothetical protein